MTQLNDRELLLNGFIKWDTSRYDCPVHKCIKVEVVFVSGHHAICKAGEVYWFYQGWITDIAYYKVLNEQDQYENVMRHYEADQKLLNLMGMEGLEKAGYFGVLSRIKQWPEAGLPDRK